MAAVGRGRLFACECGMHHVTFLKLSPLKWTSLTAGPQWQYLPRWEPSKVDPPHHQKWPKALNLDPFYSWTPQKNKLDFLKKGPLKLDQAPSS